MTVTLPDPAPLDMPPEDARALDELIAKVTAGASRHEVLAEDLSGPAASAPSWLGSDAVAAGAQVAVARDLARVCQDALSTAAGRLRAHAELLAATRAAVARLRSEQHDDYAAGWRRLAREVDYQQAALSSSPAVQAIVDEVGSADRARRNRHAVLLEELAGDAAATGRVLTASSAVVGGRARPGDTNEVIAALAARLPGWGDIELATLGRGLADRLFGTSLDGAGLNSSAADMALFAHQPAFAAAFLTALGPARMRVLLRALGDGRLGPVNALSRVLAAAMAAAGPGGLADGVLQARYLLPSAGDDDAVASGMAVVLRAGDVPTATVAEWTRQMVLLTHGENPADGIRTPIWGYPLNDPLLVAIGVLAGRQAVAECAQLLGDPATWQTLLLHRWSDGGAGLSGVITAAAQAPGLTGEASIRTGLGVIGDGLPIGSPRLWTVDRTTVGQLRPALGAALAAHIDVALQAMSAANGGWINDSELAVLRGIGNVSVDSAALRTISHALDVREMATLLGPPTSPALVLPGVLTPAAWVAVREYGRRLDYALHGYEQQENAQAKAALFDWSLGLLQYSPGLFGLGAGIVLPYLAQAMGAGGRWDNGSSGAALTPTSGGGGSAAQARQVYDRILRELGVPAPPTSPDFDWRQPLIDGAQSAAEDMEDRKAQKTKKMISPLEELVHLIPK